MTRIYTRSGDGGESGLANGERINKTDQLFAVMGDVDELNAQLGMMRALSHDKNIDQQLSKIQHKLFDVGAQVAQYKDNNITQGDVTQLEAWIDTWQDQLEPLKQFILPAGNQAGSAAHLARSICRRAERGAWQAANNHEIEPEVMQYLNRLSDYLFVLARILNGGDEVFWQAG
ncbi:cob(I)yrinic acid a,c-diamide adenosyltransferase [Marinicella sp. S1101]|uniref:cob(I)yrinic acid a,c-diamide adenosyltransferase n=1 Tax=Marinicella marina TaxID=2996016 RepID=UPI0022610068|nr:cob(I)yrinic acid a,c-diamide adenosyltransferase [Marinicella marina]MCX7553694.1 cob(I)yrinic acid a,c-diamide adenosyltransferase [Marinicella marina]MDJ1140784.1 cob(I)yrinic acid a,c-diamide adenosyltransferase [Marinicella marina]